MKFDNYMILEFPSKSINEGFARAAVAAFAAVAVFAAVTARYSPLLAVIELSVAFVLFAFFLI